MASIPVYQLSPDEWGFLPNKESIIVGEYRSNDNGSWNYVSYGIASDPPTEWILLYHPVCKEYFNYLMVNRMIEEISDMGGERLDDSILSLTNNIALQFWLHGKLDSSDIEDMFSYVNTGQSYFVYNS
jgi:hypothetical protein